MIGLSGGPEAFLPPLIQDKVKDTLHRKKPLKIEKDVFKTPQHEKAPANSFIINVVCAKFKFVVKKPMEDTKPQYERDAFSKEAAEKFDDEEDEDCDEEG